MSERIKTLIIYAGKCITGSAIIFGLSYAFHYNDISWCLISTLLVLSPDVKEAIPLALNRIKANLAGAGIGVLALLISPYNILNITIALGLTVFICDAFKLATATRSALAAVVIIMLHGEGKHLWDTALERVAAVLVGCVLALIVTYIFHLNIRPGKEQAFSNSNEG